MQTVIQESGNTTGTYPCSKKKKWNEVRNNMKSKQKRTALVTGGSSGIGRCTAVALSKAGYIVYEFSRRDVPVGGVKHMCVDVTDEASVQEAVGQILLERGSIEILVNCAGFGISGAVEFTESEQAKAQFNVNFFWNCQCKQSCSSFYAQIPQRSYCQYQFCGSSGTHSVSGILFSQ